VRGIPLWSRHEATILQATEDLWCTSGMAYVMWLPLLEGGISCLRSSSPNQAEHLQNHIKNHFSVRDILILWAVRRWNENRGIRLTQTYLGSDQVCSPLAQVKAAAAHARRLKRKQRKGKLILSLWVFHCRASNSLWKHPLKPFRIKINCFHPSNRVARISMKSRLSTPLTKDPPVLWPH
jgi:hypothetical protein